MHDTVLTMCSRARVASETLRIASHDAIDRALDAIIEGLNARAQELLAANQRDVTAATKAGQSPAFIDRLTITEARIRDMIDGVAMVRALPHPLGTVVAQRTPPNGLHLSKVRVPLGVIAFIYESRPNVTIDAAILALKSGNAIILRGGKEAIHSNSLLTAIIRDALTAAQIPVDAVQLLADLDYARVTELIQMRGYVDLVIPRGGQKLIETIGEQARVPVLKHEKGVCHVFVDKSADIEQALKIAYDAKMQRPGTCNAMETLLVDAQIAPTFIPLIVQKFRDGGCEVRGDTRVKQLVADVLDATEDDWYTEYLDAIVSIKIVSSLAEAIDHIGTYGSKHTDCILATDQNAIDTFCREVDSAAVLSNCSTRLHDGFEFGMGAEIGISTDKFHARGPVGLEELTSTKWVAAGTGQTRA